MANFRVAIQYEDKLGYLEYDEDTKAIGIVLDDEKAKAAAKEFLAQEHEVMLPFDSLKDFRKVKILAKDSLKSFQTAITRLWEATGVHVDWSRPVDYVIEHPRYE
ncbi:hypothetical protein TAMA11512_02210 [Selenomonas sp. TAMA-11512]|uniref:hypothetical protein n=1 Tax=Selenomonas sp. TAMA-11512 TaxID=3095337 RepID=UPI00308C9CAF|nr:hypothetical protein TAMA11512_02210 [Selenomonas sp. TAMA-11512]